MQRFITTGRRAVQALFNITAVAVVASLAPGLAYAEFPERPIRMIVPFPPGGGTDLLARLVGPRLSGQLKQQVVVDNRGGADGRVGTELLSRAAADGYTIGLMDTGFSINPSLYSPLPYDAIKSFSYIAIVASSPIVLVMNPKANVRNSSELLAYAKRNPSKLTYASAGSGSINNLAAQLMMLSTQTAMLHVPYKGGGPALTDVLAGNVDLMFASPSAVKQHIESGKLIAIGVTGDRKSPALPAVPTLGEGTKISVNADALYTLLAPQGVARDVLARLTEAVTVVLQDKQFVAQLNEFGFNAEGVTGAKSIEQMRMEIAKWRRVVDAAGIKPD